MTLRSVSIGAPLDKFDSRNTWVTWFPEIRVPRMVDGLISPYYTEEKLWQLSRDFHEKKLPTFADFCQYLVAFKRVTNDELDKIAHTPWLQIDTIMEKWNDTYWMTTFTKILLTKPANTGIDFSRSLAPFAWVNFLQVLEEYFLINKNSPKD